MNGVRRHPPHAFLFCPAALLPDSGVHAMPWLKSICGLALVGGCTMAVQVAPSAAAPHPVEGQWGGEQVQLVLDASGGRIETDCASGTFEQHQPGPQRADETVVQAGALFSGEVKDGVMSLSVTPDGGRAMQQFRLRKGHSGKLIRCM